MIRKPLKSVIEENQIKCIDCVNSSDYDDAHKNTENQYILGNCKHKKYKVLLNRVDKNCKLSKKKIL